MKQIENIDVSLSLGNILDKKQLCVLYLGIGISCCFPLLTLVMLCIPQVEWDIQVSVLMGLGNIFSVALLSVFVFIKCKDSRLKKQIAVWLEDAIEVKGAYSKQIDEKRLGFQPKAIKIQVKFCLDGKSYKRESTAKVFGGITGYVGCFNRYADKEINILYSQKHDEVLILKDN